MNGITCCSVSIVVLFDRRIGLTSTLVYLVERILMSPLLLLVVAGAFGLFALTELGHCDGSRLSDDALVEA